MNKFNFRKTFLKILLISGGFIVPILFLTIIDFVYTRITKNYLNVPGISFWSDGNKIRPKLEVNPQNGFYQPAKNLSGLAYYGKFPYHLETDQCGYRISSKSNSKKDLELINKQSKDKTPVIFMGDSFVYGSGVDYSESLVGHYSRLSGRSTVNLGVGSYSPTSYIYRLEYYLNECPAKNIKNHDVVVLIDLSDVQDEAKHWFPTGEGKQPINLYRLPLYSKTNTLQYKILRSLKNTFAKNLSVTYTTLSKTKKKLSPSTDISNQVDASYSFTYKNWDSLYPHYAPLGVKNGLKKTRNQIKKLSELIHSNGGKLHLVTYPREQLINNTSTLLNWEEFIESACVPNICKSVIHTQSEIEKRKKDSDVWRDEFYLPNDGHFNSKGYEIIASSINKIIK